jgi:hypothetical protein
MSSSSGAIRKRSAFPLLLHTSHLCVDQRSPRRSGLGSLVSSPAGALARASRAAPWGWRRRRSSASFSVSSAYVMNSGAPFTPPRRRLCNLFPHTRGCWQGAGAPLGAPRVRNAPSPLSLSAVKPPRLQHSPQTRGDFPAAPPPAAIRGTLSFRHRCMGVVWAADRPHPAPPPEPFRASARAPTLRRCVRDPRGKRRGPGQWL